MTIETLQNAGTKNATGTVRCRRCGYLGEVNSYAPAMSVYQDIVCPQCGSTDNRHNAIYQDRLFARMEEMKSDAQSVDAITEEEKCELVAETVVQSYATPRLENEQCWLLFGGMERALWWGKMSKRSSDGQPFEVAFDYNYVIKRQLDRKDICGFMHTHPHFEAYPSSRDHRTMHAWVTCFGKPLICAIAGADGLRAFLYFDDESLPIECQVKKFGRLLVGTVESNH